ncbi:MAG: prolipoprotein diacylglyceryl transferase [Bacteroidota bacterium]
MPDPSYFHWNIDPVIVQLGPFALRWYGLLFATGFVLGFYFMRYVFQRERKPEADLDKLLLYMLAGTVVGARLGHCFFYNPGYFLANPLEILAIHKGGLASHGGAIGIIIALYFYSKSRPKQPFLWVIDRIAVATALAGVLIRLANFFNSEILGVPTDVAWAVVFERIDDLPRHPSMLYESISYLLIWGLLFSLYRKLGSRTPHGLLLGLFFILVFSARFFIEFVKESHADFVQYIPFELHVGQVLSIPLVLAGVYLVVRALPKLRESATV